MKQPPHVMVWDWRQQPDLEELAAAVLKTSGGRVHLVQVDTGGDEYALAIADHPITGGEAIAAYEDRTHG
jgi:hypothetical protein